MGVLQGAEIWEPAHELLGDLRVPVGLTAFGIYTGDKRKLADMCLT